MAMGSDVGPFPHGTQAREFVLMVQYGMKPLAALQAGTLNGAKLLGWEGQIGNLKPGYLADIVAVPGNPLEDISALQHVVVCDEGRCGGAPSLNADNDQRDVVVLRRTGGEGID